MTLVEVRCSLPPARCAIREASTSRSILSARSAVSYTWHQVYGRHKGSTSEFLGSSKDTFQLLLAVPSVTAHVGSQSSSRVYRWQPYTWCLILDALNCNRRFSPFQFFFFFFISRPRAASIVISSCSLCSIRMKFFVPSG